MTLDFYNVSKIVLLALAYSNSDILLISLYNLLFSDSLF